jgi:hypothetical protein
MDQNALFDEIRRGCLPATVGRELLDAPKANGAFQKLTPLEVALFCGRCEVAVALVERGAGVDARDAVGYTPLLYFAGRKELEALTAIDWLLAHGADPHAVTAKGTSVLHRTAWDSGFFPDHFVRVARKLLAAGASHSARNQTAFTPLLHAVRSHGAELIRALVEAGADVNAQSSAGATALHLVPVNYLAWRDLDEQHTASEREAAGESAESIAHMMIATLLELGARRDLKTSEGSTAHDLARRAHMPEDLAALLAG